MKIRPASRTDAPLLARLNQTVQQLHADSRPDSFKPPSESEPVIRFFEEILSRPENHVFVAEAEGKGFGYLYCQVVRLPANPFNHARQFVYIHQLSVEPAWRRRGVGRALVTAAAGLARNLGITRLGLDTWSFNETAQAFFTELGFRTFNLRMEAFVDEPDAVRGQRS